MLFDSDRVPPSPELGATDYAQSVAKFGLAVIAVHHPQLAPLLVAWDQLSGIIFNRSISNVLQPILSNLQRRGVSPESLFRDEQFVSALVLAMQSATKTGQAKKIESLRNAVLNTALGKEPDANRQQAFFALVDRFSETHLILLQFFKDPAAYFQSKGQAVPTIPSPAVEPVIKVLAYQLVTSAMPFLGEQLKSTSEDRSASFFQFIEVAFADLVSANLIVLDRHHETWSIPRFDRGPAPAEVKPLITHLGEDFLAFITEPPEQKE